MSDNNNDKAELPPNVIERIHALANNAREKFGGPVKGDLAENRTIADSWMHHRYIRNLLGNNLAEDNSPKMASVVAQALAAARASSSTSTAETASSAPTASAPPAAADERADFESSDVLSAPQELERAPPAAADERADFESSDVLSAPQELERLVALVDMDSKRFPSNHSRHHHKRQDKGLVISSELPHAVHRRFAHDQKYRDSLHLHGTMLHICKHVRVNNVMRKHDKLITLRSDTPLGDALARLAENSISSAPVVDSSGTVVGLFEAADGLRTTMRILEKYLGDGIVSAMASTTVGAIVDDDEHRGRFYSIDDDAELSELVLLFTRTRARHIIVLTGGKMTSIVTPRDVVKFATKIETHGHSPNEFTVKAVKIHVPKEKIIAVNEHVALWHAFETALSHSVGAVAVLNDDENLIGQVSIDDVKALDFTNLDLLVGTVKDFLELKKKDDANTKFQTFALDDNVYTLADYFATTRAHDAWIASRSKDELSDEHKLVGVIAQIDLLSWFYGGVIAQRVKIYTQ